MEKFNSFIEYAKSFTQLWDSLKGAEEKGLIIIDEENDAITATNRLLWTYPGLHEALNVIIDQYTQKNLDIETNFKNLIKGLDESSNKNENE